MSGIQTTGELDPAFVMNAQLDPFVENCDLANFTGAYLQVIALLCALKIGGFLLHLCVMPAAWRFAHKRPAYFILLSLNGMHCLSLLQQCAIYVQYFCEWRIQFPLELDAYLFRWCSSSILFLYVLLAANRTMAIYTVFKYSDTFSYRLTKCYVAWTLLLGMFYSVLLNLPNQIRAFTCLALTSYAFPGNTMDYVYNEKRDSLISGIWVTASGTTIACCAMPIALYFACLAKIALDVFKRLMKKQDVGAVEQGSEQSALLRERSRLYLICLLSTVPRCLLLVQTYFVEPSRYSDLEWALVNYTFHVHQPLLMLIFSSDLRMEMLRMFVQLRNKCSNKTTTAASNGPVVAWT